MDLVTLAHKMRIHAIARRMAFALVKIHPHPTGPLRSTRRRGVTDEAIHGGSAPENPHNFGQWWIEYGNLRPGPHTLRQMGSRPDRDAPAPRHNTRCWARPNVIRSRPWAQRPRFDQAEQAALLTPPARAHKKGTTPKRRPRMWSHSGRVIPSVRTYSMVTLVTLACSSCCLGTFTVRTPPSSLAVRPSAAASFR